MPGTFADNQRGFEGAQNLELENKEAISLPLKSQSFNNQEALNELNVNGVSPKKELTGAYPTEFKSIEVNLYNNDEDVAKAVDQVLPVISNSTVWH